MQNTEFGAERRAWERPVLRRLDASDAQQNDNMKSIEDLNAGPHLGDIMGRAVTS